MASRAPWNLASPRRLDQISGVEQHALPVRAGRGKARIAADMDASPRQGIELLMHLDCARGQHPLRLRLHGQFQLLADEIGFAVRGRSQLFPQGRQREERTRRPARDAGIARQLQAPFAAAGNPVQRLFQRCRVALDEVGEAIEAPQHRAELRGSQRHAIRQFRQHAVMGHGAAPGPFALVHSGFRRRRVRWKSADDGGQAAERHKLDRRGRARRPRRRQAARRNRTLSAPRRRHRYDRPPPAPPLSCRAPCPFHRRIASPAVNLKQNGFAQPVSGLRTLLRLGAGQQQPIGSGQFVHALAGLLAHRGQIRMVLAGEAPERGGDVLFE